MKKLILKFSLHLAVIAFAAFTKWWYVLPVDTVQTFYWGFPFACVGEGWQTSGALQFFILETLVDFMFYFLVCYGMVWIIFLIYKIKTVSKLLLKTLWSLTIFFLILWALIISFSYPTFYIKRNYDWKILSEGYLFIWQKTPNPDTNQYQPSENQNFKKN
ncbi:MAG: hypothetical protein ACEQSR_01210 [Candidatus Methylacidiphilales bacterium]